MNSMFSLSLMQKEALYFISHQVNWRIFLRDVLKYARVVTKKVLARRNVTSKEKYERQAKFKQHPFQLGNFSWKLLRKTYFVNTLLCLESLLRKIFQPKFHVKMFASSPSRNNIGRLSTLFLQKSIRWCLARSKIHQIKKWTNFYKNSLFKMDNFLLYHLWVFIKKVLKMHFVFELHIQ